MQKKKTIGSILLVVGALINVIPELISSVIGVAMMVGGLYLLNKSEASKGIKISSIVINSVSILICVYFLLVELILKSGGFKLGLFPMSVTAIVSIVLSVAVIVFTVRVSKTGK